MPDWIIHLEGRGPTHEGELGDANSATVALINYLQQQGHALTQARFTSDRPEENLLDWATLDLHEQLVAKGVAALEGLATNELATPFPTNVHPGLQPPTINPTAPPPGSGIPNAN